MKKVLISGLMIALAFVAGAETVTNNLDVQGGFIYNHGIVNPGDVGMTFTNAGIRDITISAGQLSGVDPETGTIITNVANLLPIKAQSIEVLGGATFSANVTISGDLEVSGEIIGDGSGLTDLTASQVGLGNIDNTSDLNKPVSTNQQAALDAVETKVLSANAVIEKVMVGNISNSYVVVRGGEYDGAVSYFEGFFEGGPHYASSNSVYVYYSDAVDGWGLDWEGNSSVYDNASSGYLPPYDGWTENGTNVDVKVEFYSGASASKLDKSGGAISGDLTVDNLTVRSNLVVGTGSATGLHAVAQGENTVASGDYSHAEGEEAKATGHASHAEGFDTLATKGASHAEGFETLADGIASHAEGEYSRATGRAAHAEGGATLAAGDYSHAAGRGAHATNTTTYVWSDGTEIGSTTTKQYTVYAENGIRLLGGRIIGDGSGLTNLNVSSLSGTISAQSMPTSGTWNAAGVIITNLSVSDTISVGGDSLTVSTNLNVEGVISGDGSGLTGLPAGGNDGDLQFNDNGVLSGNTNYFIHPETGKLSFNAPEGYLFRGYTGSVADENLIYSVRNENGLSVVRLLKNTNENIRLTGDGDAIFTGDLQIGGTLFGDGSGLTNLSTQTLDNRYIQQTGGIITGTLQVVGQILGDGFGLTNLPPQDFGEGYFIGEDQVLYSTIENHQDILFAGVGAGEFNTNTEVVAVGAYAGQYASGESGVYVGQDAGQYSTGERVVLIGEDAGQCSTGIYVVAIGEKAGRYNTGDYTVMLMRDAGYDNSGDHSVLIGQDAGRNNSGDYAHLIGRHAGRNNTGTNVLFMGNYAGRNNTGSRVIALGRRSGMNNTDDDRLFIDVNNASTNTLIYGEFDNNLIRINGDLDVTGTLTGDGSALTNLNLSLYAGDNLTWNGTLNAQPGYADSNAVVAVSAQWPNLDTDSTDDFEGSFTNLTGVPTGLADGDDVLTSSQVVMIVTAGGFAETTDILLLDGTQPMGASLNMGGHSITNISTNSLVYADGKSVRQTYVDVSGDTVTGDLTVQGAFVASYIPPQGDLLMGSYTNGFSQ